ncbi:MAG: site-specific integrase [Acidisphaera sp.]|nr:site-specific integrase [Acidisphaera sp.]
MAGGKGTRRPVLHPSRDPARRSLTLAEWPEADRQVWHALLEPGDVLEPGGAGAGWSPATRKVVRAANGQWLAWLQRTGRLDADTAPTERVTPLQVAGYVKHLEPQVGGMTIVMYVYHLGCFCRAAAPDTDWAWLSRLVARLKRRVVPSVRKRPRLMPIGELFALGLRTMREAEADPDGAPWLTACRYRDGLIVALLAARPLRLRNLTQIGIGRHLIRGAGGYTLRFTAAETKPRRHLEFPVPDALVVPLERYLSNHRPLLCARAGARSGGNGAPSGTQLWVSGQGSAMIERSVYQTIMTLTGNAFGRPINPNLFRDCAATSIATEDPEHVRITLSILGHSTLRTSERSYNHANSLEAMRRYQHRILHLREQSRRLRR